MGSCFIPICQGIPRIWIVVVRHALQDVFDTAPVKNAVRMHVFPASGANLPLKFYAATKQTTFRLRNSKIKLHTQKISLEFYEHKVH